RAVCHPGRRPAAAAGCPQGWFEPLSASRASCRTRSANSPRRPAAAFAPRERWSYVELRKQREMIGGFRRGFGADDVTAHDPADMRLRHEEVVEPDLRLRRWQRETGIGGVQD